MVEEEYLPLVKFMIVPIALGNVESGAVGVRFADALVSEWVAKGYTLLSAVRGEWVAGDRVQIVCTLTRNA